MFWLVFLFQIFMVTLLRSLRLHLGIANDSGSPDAFRPFMIEEPTLAKAIYGRLAENKNTEYYSFFAEKEAKVRAILLVPATAYHRGLRARMSVYGPGLSEAGEWPEVSEFPINIMQTDFLIVQRYLNPLPQTGQYQVAIHRTEGSGTYCFCVGDGDGGRSDAAMRVRIEALLNQNT